ncbi:MAG: AMP-binding protein, partial [Sciscionella sp.]
MALVPGRPFFITPNDSLTFAEFDERTDRLAAVLLAHGAKAGEPVGMYLPSGLELALTYWACQKLGGIAVPLNPMYREFEIAGAVATAGISLMVTDVVQSSQIGERETAALTLLSWDEPGVGSLATMLAGADPISHRPQPGFDDPVCLFLTSGTTGRPKAVLQTQRNQITALTTMFTQIGLRYGAEVCLNTMPLFNNFGATGVMNMSVFAGASMITTSRWDPSLAVELITR